MENIRIIVIAAILAALGLIEAPPAFAQCPGEDCPQPASSRQVNSDPASANQSSSNLPRPGLTEPAQFGAPAFPGLTFVDPAPLTASPAPGFETLDVPMRYESGSNAGGGAQALGMALEGLAGSASPNGGGGAPATQAISQYLQAPPTGASGNASEALAAAAESFGYEGAHAFEGWSLGDLQGELAQGHPVVVALGGDGQGLPAHYVTVTGVSADGVWVAYNDPMAGALVVPADEFLRDWQSQGSSGVAVGTGSPPGQPNYAPWLALIAGLMALISTGQSGLWHPESARTLVSNMIAWTQGALRQSPASGVLSPSTASASLQPQRVSVGAPFNAPPSRSWHTSGPASRPQGATASPLPAPTRSTAVSDAADLNLLPPDDPSPASANGLSLASDDTHGREETGGVAAVSIAYSMPTILAPPLQEPVPVAPSPAPTRSRDRLIWEKLMLPEERAQVLEDYRARYAALQEEVDSLTGRPAVFSSPVYRHLPPQDRLAVEQEWQQWKDRVQVLAATPAWLERGDMPPGWLGGYELSQSESALIGELFLSPVFTSQPADLDSWRLMAATRNMDEVDLITGVTGLDERRVNAWVEAADVHDLPEGVDVYAMTRRSDEEILGYNILVTEATTTGIQTLPLDEYLERVHYKPEEVEANRYNFTAGLVMIAFAMSSASPEYGSPVQVFREFFRKRGQDLVIHVDMQEEWGGCARTVDGFECGAARLRSISPYLVAHEMGHVLNAEVANAIQRGLDPQSTEYDYNQELNRRLAALTPYNQLNAVPPPVWYLDENGERHNLAARGVPRTDDGYMVMINGVPVPWDESLGFYSVTPFQQHHFQMGYADSETVGEEFADMFLNWVFRNFADNPAGRARYQWFQDNMSNWLAYRTQPFQEAWIPE